MAPSSHGANPSCGVCQGMGVHMTPDGEMVRCFCVEGPSIIEKITRALPIGYRLFFLDVEDVPEEDRYMPIPDVGMGRAKELIFSGAMITAKEAAEMGLVNKTVPSDELDSTVNWTAAKIAGNAPIALKYAKEGLNKVFDVPIEEGLKHDAKTCAACFATEDIREGIKSVFEKRKATFKGK